MAHRTALWTRDLIQRRRALHSRIDGIARANPAEAARTRLALYSAIHDFDQGTTDAASLADEFDLLDVDLDTLTTAAA